MKKLVLPAFLSLPVAVSAQSVNSEIGKVVSEVCQKQVVLLGEDSHHGGGETLKVKVELIKRLVNSAAFRRSFSRVNYMTMWISKIKLLVEPPQENKSLTP